MGTETYTYLLELVTLHIIKEDTCTRRAISSHERMTATFLTTGQVHKDLEYIIIIKLLYKCIITR